MASLASLSPSGTLAGLHIGEIAVLAFGLLFLAGWIAEEFTHSEKWKRWRRVFLIAAIIGVTGEWIADIAVFELTEHLQSIDEGTVAALGHQAAQLNNEASQARLADATLENENLILRGKLQDIGSDMAHATVRLKEADLQIAGLRKDADIARKEIADATMRTKEAQARIAEANEKAEAERLARVKLEKSLSWRTLTEEQLHSISVALIPFKGENIDMLAYRDEPDAMLLSMHLGLAIGGFFMARPGTSGSLIFSGNWLLGMQLDPEANRGKFDFVPEAGWVVHHFTVLEFSRIGDTGIRVETTENAGERDVEAAKALVAALKAANLEASGPTPIVPCTLFRPICENARDLDVRTIDGKVERPTSPIELTILFRPPPSEEAK